LSSIAVDEPVTFAGMAINVVTGDGVITTINGEKAALRFSASAGGIIL
jgi:hypothetical protein